MPNFRNIAFVVTKPLQIMVAMTLFKKNIKDCIVTMYIVNSFYDSIETKRRLAKTYHDEMNFVSVKSKKEACLQIAKCFYNEIYIDSDVGFKNFIILTTLKIFNPSLIINVYEEGAGTYSKDLYENEQFRKKLLGLFRLSTFFGGYVFTSNLFLYRPEEFPNKIQIGEDKLIKIVPTLWSFIKSNHSDLEYIFGISKENSFNINHTCCCIYLTSWSIDDVFIKKFETFEGDLFIKLHPHLRGKFKNSSLININRSAPIELIIYGLLKKYNRIKIYDHGSASRFYIDDLRVSYNLV
jgi:hypothetical protein